MNHRPLTTVIIPAFNAEDYLERTLLSALQQTYSELEVLVVNDASTDNTESLAQSFASKDSRLRVITVPNGGVASARNKGIEQASGKFVAFLDADDLWHPLKIEKQVAALSVGAGAGAAASYTQMRIIDWEDRIIRNGSGIACSGSIFARHLFSRPVGNGSSLLVRREIAIAVGGFDSTWRARGIGGCEDLDFELKIASKYLLAGIRCYLVGYRSHPNNMSVNGLSLARSVMATVEQHINAHPELPPWAIRKIRASTLEFALKNIASVGEWTFFAAELARLQRMDILRGLQYAGRLSGRKLLPVRAFITRTQHANGRPLFNEISPDVDADPLGRSRWWDRWTIDRLAVVDQQRLKTLRILV